MNYWDGARWISGPVFAAWLEERGYTCTDLNIDTSALAKWRAGDWLSVWRADKILTPLYLHVSELPDEAWIERTEPRTLTKRERRQVAKEYGRGDALADITQRYGIRPGTVRHIASALRVKRPPRESFVERRERLIDRSGGPDACWPWTGRLDSRGYPILHYEHRVVRPHREMVEDARRVRLPHRAPLKWSCGNTNCCNPDHIEVFLEDEAIAA